MLNIIPILIILSSLFFSVKATNSWISPGSFFNTFWLIGIIFPLIFAPEFYVNFYGLMYIATISMSCSSGSVLASIISLKKSYNHKKNLINNKQRYALHYPLILFVFITLFGVINLLVFTSSSYSLPLNVNNLLLIPNLISIDRYNEALDYPIYVTYPLYFNYPSNIIAGVLICKAREKFAIKAMCFIPLLLSILIGIIEGARSGILLGLILFVSTIISTKARESQGLLNISFIKISFLGLFIIISFTTFFVYIQWLRQGLDALLLDFMILKIKAYFFGYLSAFTVWFENIDTFLKPKTLLSTFAGPMNLFGLLERNLGFYEPIIINDFTSTNIFTSFRGLINDFSLLGVVFVMFFFGFYFQLEFQKESKNEIEGIIPLSIFYSFTIYSPLISIFHYNSIVFSWLIAFFVFKIFITK